MKKYIIIITFIVALTALNAFDEFVPANDMTGKYLKVTTCYQKSFADFDGGFNYFGLMLTKPNIYKKFSLGTDITSFGDNIFRDLTLNLSTGYSFKNKWVIAISGGVIQRSIDDGNLIFNEAETINAKNGFSPNIGLSIASRFYEDKLHFKLGLTHINQPSIYILDDKEKMPIKLYSELNWQINTKYNLGTSLSLNDNQYYVGLNFGIKFPYPILEHNFKLSKERISYQPEFHTFNYWDVRFAYNYYLDNDELGYKNYGICLSYRYSANKTAPVINWINRETSVDTASYNVAFNIKNIDRIKNVTVKLNEEPIYQKSNIWEFESKHFVIPVTLSEGDNGITVEIQPVVGSVYANNVTVRYQKPVIAMPDTIKTLQDSTEMVTDTTKVEVEENSKVDTLETNEDADAIILVTPADSSKTSDKDYYTVKKGDCLWNIARKPEIYDNAWKWKVIYDNNREDIKNPALIYPGQKFLIIKEHKGDDVN